MLLAQRITRGGTKELSVTQGAHVARMGYCPAGPNVVDLRDVVVDRAPDQIEKGSGGRRPS